MAVNVLLPAYALGDKEGCTLKDGKVYAPASFHDVYKKYVEAGWLCSTESPDVGGQGLPLVVRSACLESMFAANYAFLTYTGLTHGAAHLIEQYGTEEQKKKYMYNMYAGKWTGTMCLTEPGAGSDVGALRTSAKRLPDGTFSITGTKIFISCGDHDLVENIVHPVLARIEGDLRERGAFPFFSFQNTGSRKTALSANSTTCGQAMWSIRWESRGLQPVLLILATRGSASVNFSEKRVRA